MLCCVFITFDDVVFPTTIMQRYYSIERREFVCPKFLQTQIAHVDTLNTGYHAFGRLEFERRGG